MSLVDTIYGSLKEQDIKTDTAVDLCHNLTRLNRCQQWVFLRRVQGYTQTEIANEMCSRQQRVSEIIQGPLYTLVSILEYAR